MSLYYERGPVRLYLGDALDIAPSFAEKGIVLFDPPYSAHTHSKSRAGSRKLANGQGKPQINRIVDFGFPPLTPRERRFFARTAERLSSRWTLVFSDPDLSWQWRLSFAAVGLEYVRTGAWVKLASAPQFTGDRPAAGHEEITIAHQPVSVAGKKRWNGRGSRAVWEHAVVQERGAKGSALEPRLHSTQKPESLMIELVELFSEPGELVYDFTCGSGTTGVGCLRARGAMPGVRRFVGVERQEAEIEKCARRLDAELNGVSYHAARAGQMGLFPLGAATPKEGMGT